MHLDWTMNMEKLEEKRMVHTSTVKTTVITLNMMNLIHMIILCVTSTKVLHLQALYALYTTILQSQDMHYQKSVRKILIVKKDISVTNVLA